MILQNSKLYHDFGVFDKNSTEAAPFLAPRAYTHTASRACLPATFLRCIVHKDGRVQHLTQHQQLHLSAPERWLAESLTIPAMSRCSCCTFVLALPHAETATTHTVCCHPACNDRAGTDHGQKSIFICHIADWVDSNSWRLCIDCCKCNYCCCLCCAEAWS